MKFEIEVEVQLQTSTSNFNFKFQLQTLTSNFNFNFSFKLQLQTSNRVNMCRVKKVLWSKSKIDFSSTLDQNFYLFQILSKGLSLLQSGVSLILLYQNQISQTQSITSNLSIFWFSFCLKSKFILRFPSCLLTLWMTELNPWTWGNIALILNKARKGLWKGEQKLSHRFKL